MYLNSDTRLVQPTEEQFFAGGGLAIDPSSDLVVEYERLNEPPANTEWPTSFWMASFHSRQDYGDGAGEQLTVQYMCISVSRDDDRTQFTIPQSLFSAPDFPADGTLTTGLMSHLLTFDDERLHALDLVGLNGKRTEYHLASP